MTNHCCGVTNRRGRPRPCGQPAICVVLGKRYCYYHNPLSPKKFGQGYSDHARAGGKP